MHKAKKKHFTLVELMITIGILIILMAVSWVAGSKVLRGTKVKQTKADLVMLVNAVEQYKDRWGEYPFTNGNGQYFKFGEKLSPVKVGANYNGTRPMFIDYQKHSMESAINVGDEADPEFENYSDYNIQNPESTYILDPYKNAYRYDYDSSTETYTIYSDGLDGDEVSSDDL